MANSAYSGLFPLCNFHSACTITTHPQRYPYERLSLFPHASPCPHSPLLSNSGKFLPHTQYTAYSYYTDANLCLTLLCYVSTYSYIFSTCVSTLSPLRSRWITTSCPGDPAFSSQIHTSPLPIFPTTSFGTRKKPATSSSKSNLKKMPSLPL